MWKWIKAMNPFAAELKITKGLRDFARVLLNEALAQLAQAEIELADKAFYVREFAAVSQERDALKKRNDVQAEQLRRIDREISPLMSEVASLKAKLQRATNHNQTITEGYKEEIADLRAEARAAIAHMRQRPEGLPTADLLKTIAIAFYQYSGVAEMVLDKHDEARFGRILAAIAPYLRDPVGKPELDVTDEQAHTESNDQFMRSMKTAQNIVAGWTQEDRTNNSIGFPSGLPLESE